MASLAAVLIVGLAAVSWADSQAERAQRLANLSAEQKEELLRKKERFDALDSEEKQRLRELHESLQRVPEATQLSKVMERYTIWLKALQPAQRSEVLSLPADQRIERIKQIVSDQERQRFLDFAQDNLPPEDLERIYQWLDKFVAENEKKILDAVRHDHDRRRIRDIDDDKARRRMLIPHLGARWFNPKMPYPSKDEISTMVMGLSETTRKELDKAKDAKEREERESRLVGAAIGSIAIPPPSEEELRKFYASLPAEKRAPLENLDDAQLQPALRKLYRMEKFSKGGGSWRGGPPRGGRGSGGSPPPDFDRPPPGFANPK